MSRCLSDGEKCACQRVAPYCYTDPLSPGDVGERGRNSNGASCRVGTSVLIWHHDMGTITLM